MPVYVLITRLEPAVMSDPRGRKAIGKQWKRVVDETCPGVKWLAHYALLGPYDFMDIYEADDDEVAQKVSLISRTMGAVSAENWPATPYERFLRVAEEVEAAMRRDE